jgi:hypothetical protein
MVISILFGLLHLSLLFALPAWNSGSLFPVHHFSTPILHNISQTYQPLSQLKFNNSFVEYFSNDGTTFYSFIRPTKVSDPVLINLNYEVADLLGISFESTKDVADYLRYWEIRKKCKWAKWSFEVVALKLIFLVETNQYQVMILWQWLMRGTNLVDLLHSLEMGGHLW